MQLELAHKNALNILRESLPEYLTYHCLEHTIDVYNETERIAKAENITSNEDLTIVLTAAAYHDSGFIVSEINHEQQSCIICTDCLPGFGYSDPEIAQICDIIMATKIPQSPQSKWCNL